jgi:thioredoxin reductase (NADPH)
LPAAPFGSTIVPDRYDIVIAGGGAAGFTAGIYAAHDRCRALLLERFSPGGQVLNCEHIENDPGFPDGVAGYTLGPLLRQQATTKGFSHHGHRHGPGTGHHSHGPARGPGAG